MGTRGRDEHHKLRFGDFTVKSTTDGHEYVEFSAECGTKTRSGETEKSTNANARSFKPKMWATPDTPTRCPVRLYRAFIERRPSEMCAADSPFYLAVNHHRKPTSFWYKKQPLGVTLLNRIMKELADKGGIQGKKTNHSARKTMIQTLCSANVPDSTIMQLAIRTQEHHQPQSLYKKPSLDQQRSMSNLLSTLQADPSPSCSLSVSKRETNLHSNQLCSTPGLLSNATFNGCTVNIHVNTPSSQLFTNDTNQAPTSTPKRPRLDM